MSKHASVLALKRCRHTVYLLSELPEISYANWNVTIEVHAPEPLVALYREMLSEFPCTVLVRPEFRKRGTMRRYLEGLGNPGWLVMCDDDFRGLDRFPSVNGNDVVQDPKAIAGLLRTAFADMTNPAVLGTMDGLDFSESSPPWMFGFRVRECEDRARMQGTNGPRSAVPRLGKRQPLLQNLVAIRQGAPGEYPDLNYCEDAWRQAGCRKIAGDNAIATHLIAKIDFDRKGTNARNKKDPAYQEDRKMFEAEFPKHKTLQERSSWTEEGRQRAATLQPTVSI